MPGGCSTPCFSLHSEAWVWSAGIVLPSQLLLKSDITVAPLQGLASTPRGAGSPPVSQLSSLCHFSCSIQLKSVLTLLIPKPEVLASLFCPGSSPSTPPLSPLLIDTFSLVQDVATSFTPPSPMNSPSWTRLPPGVVPCDSGPILYFSPKP